MQNKTLRVLVMAAAMLLTVTSGVSASGLEDRMRSMFGSSMWNTTDPGVVEGQRRAGVFGGSFSFRTEQVNQSIASFQRPRMSYSCGSLDLFGGSFSLISAQQVVTMLKSIAANAMAYLFKLALSAISDKIVQIMDQVFSQGWFKDIMSLNSCKLGEQLGEKINGATGLEASMRGVGDRLGSWLNNALGREPDQSAAEAQEDPTRGPMDAVQARLSPAERAVIKPGNIIWNALRDAGVVDQYGVAAAEEAMSYIGTVVGCFEGEDSCPPMVAAAVGATTLSTPAELQATAKSTNITLKQLVEGIELGSEVFVLRCQGETTECLNPRPVNDTSLEGMAKVIKRRLLDGDGTTAGLYTRWLNNDSAGLTAGDRAFMTSARGLVEFSIKLGKMNEATGRDFVTEFAPVFGYEIVTFMLRDILNQTLAQLNERPKELQAETMALVQAAQKRMWEEYKAHLQNLPKKFTAAEEFARRAQWLAAANPAPL